MDTNGYIAIKGYPDYMINVIGKIISFRRKNPTIIKGKISQRGYRVVGLRNTDSERKHLLVHRLVGEAFISNPNKYPVINHKDGNQLNNDVENLEWCTVSHNTQHAYDNGMCKTTTKEIYLYKDGNFIEKFDKKKDCVEHLAKETNLSFDHIRKVISGQISKEKSEFLRRYDFIVEGQNLTRCNDYSERK